MILIGDIGNSDTKICLLNSNYRIVKRIVKNATSNSINSIEDMKNIIK